MYLTFDEYEEFGGTLDETTYNQLEFEARTVIDWWTFNRLQNEESYPEAVKRCIYKLIQLIHDQQLAMVTDGQSGDDSSAIKAGIASESNDGVSTSYNTLSAKDAVDTIQDKLNTTVQQYLQGVKNSLGRRVLYRGLYPGE